VIFVNHDNVCRHIIKHILIIYILGDICTFGLFNYTFHNIHNNDMEFVRNKLYVLIYDETLSFMYIH